MQQRSPTSPAFADVIPVVLSGGAGTRLWPLSRETKPKQFLRTLSEYTLLQETVLRVAGQPLIVCNKEHTFIIAEQLAEIGVAARAMLTEPMGRNTAPAVAAAALLLEATPSALMLVMPSDHLIRDRAAFEAALTNAAQLARDGYLVTFGIQPTSPNTGYGYIRAGDALADGFKVARFVEKPDLATAENFLADGNYSWNSGIFVFQVGAVLAEFAAQCPALLDGVRQALNADPERPGIVRLDPEIFATVPSISFDHAIMEHTGKAAVVPVSMGWSDIGSWPALMDESDKDEHGNAVVGDVVSIDSSGNYLRSEKHLVAALGLRDTIVVATEDAILVASKDKAQEVKAVVERLRAAKREQATENARTWRPWGWFETIDNGHRFRVKRIHVHPGGKLSLQKHWHRSEHWIVVTGTALVTCGDKSFVLRENESTYIPAGVVHRLENPGRIPLSMIEVQSGEYVGEDDIVRVEDIYGRA